MKVLASVLGAVLCLFGIAGFIQHDFMGMVLNPLHAGLLLAMGVIALSTGVSGTDLQSRSTCRFIGVLFGVLGIATLFADPGSSTVPGVNVSGEHFWRLVPGHLEFSTADGVRNLLIGIVGMFGCFSRRQEYKIEQAVVETKEQVAGRS